MRKHPRSDRPAVSNPAASPASTDSQRRRFLFTLGVSGAGAAAASVAAIPAVSAETGTTDQDADGRYQETTHVRDYYRTTRI
jgi:hypothetical protein